MAVVIRNLAGIDSRRCIEPLTPPGGAGWVPTSQADGSVEWETITGATDDQVATEVPITAIAALPGATNVQLALAALAVRPYRLMVGFGGDTNPVTTGDTVTFRAPDAFTVTGVRINVKTASSSGLIDVNVKKNGVTIFSTRVTIDSGEKTSVTAATPAVLSVTAVADNDELTVEVVDDGTGATGLVATIRGTTP